MAFLNIANYKESWLDFSDLILFPTGRLEIDQNILMLAEGSGDIEMPSVPFVLTLTQGLTVFDLRNAERVLCYQQDPEAEGNNDLFAICRDWDNYYVYAGPEGTITEEAIVGATEIKTDIVDPISTYWYFRLDRDAQIYRVVEVNGDTLTFEPPLQQVANIGSTIRIVAKHWDNNTGEPISAARPHVQGEKALLLLGYQNVEELQDAITLMQDYQQPDDLYLDTLTLTNQITVGNKKTGFADAPGMVKFTGGSFLGYTGSEWIDLGAAGGGAGWTPPSGANNGDILYYIDGSIPTLGATNALSVSLESTILRSGTNELLLDYDSEFIVSESIIDAGGFLSENLNLVNIDYVRQGINIFRLEDEEPINVLASVAEVNIEGEDVEIILDGLMIAGSILLITGNKTIIYAQDEASLGEGNIEEAGYLFLHSTYQISINNMLIIDNFNDQIFLNVETFFSAPTNFGAPLLINSNMVFEAQSSYPDTIPGTIVYHESHGLMAYIGGVWRNLTGDILTFAAPGTPWSTIYFDPDEDEWLPSSEILVREDLKTVQFAHSIVIGEKHPDTPLQAGMIEYVNNDIQGILRHGDHFVRVSLTNLIPEQRLPSNSVAGALMFADPTIPGWDTTGAYLTWDPLNTRLLTGEIKIGYDSGLKGTIKWDEDSQQLLWNNGVSWNAWPISSDIPTPTSLGAFLIVTGDPGEYVWTQYTGCHIEADAFVTTTIKAQTLELSAMGNTIIFDAGQGYIDTPELRTNSIIINEGGSIILTQLGSYIDAREAYINTLHVTNLDFSGYEGTLFKVEKLHFQATDGMLFTLESHENYITFTTNEVFERFRLEEVLPTAIVGQINKVGGYAIGDTELTVTGFSVILQGNRQVKIGNFWYKMEGASGIPTTQIILSEGLKESIDNEIDVEIYGNQFLITLNGQLVLTDDLTVTRLGKFDHTIQIGNELSGVADAAGMIRYNGDFQGCVESNGMLVWQSFTLSLADGTFDTPYGSSLWWDGTQWTRNNAFRMTATGVLNLQANDTAAAVPGSIRYNDSTGHFEACTTLGVWGQMTGAFEGPAIPPGTIEGSTLRWNGISDWVENPYLWSDGIKTKVTLLELEPYENFYDSGRVNRLGGYQINDSIIIVDSFQTIPALGDILRFQGDETDYEIVDINYQNDELHSIEIDPPLTQSISDRTIITIQGILPRPIAQGGQVRYNQNDYEGFIEGIGWASFTGHRSILPTRDGDPYLREGQLLFFGGLGWWAYHHLYVQQDQVSINVGLVVHGGIETYEELKAELIILGTGQPYMVDPDSGLLPSEAVDRRPPMIPGTIFYHPDRGRLMGCVVPFAMEEDDTPAWVDIVSPILVSEPLYNGQTLRYEDGWWKNTEVLMLNPDNSTINPDGEALLFTTMQHFILRGNLENNEGWFFRTEEDDVGTGGGTDLFETLSIGYESAWGTLSLLQLRTSSEQGSVSGLLLQTQIVYGHCLALGYNTGGAWGGEDIPDPFTGISEILLVKGDGLIDGELKVNDAGFFESTLMVKENLTVLNGGIYIEQGDLVLGYGDVETYRLVCETEGLFGTFIRVGFVSGGNIPIGSIRYSTPENIARGDWEGWDGEQWVSFTAGFHGQAIWGDTEHGQLTWYDSTYLGGKWKATECDTFANGSVLSWVNTYDPEGESIYSGTVYIKEGAILGMLPIEIFSTIQAGDYIEIEGHSAPYQILWKGTMVFLVAEVTVITVDRDFEDEDGSFNCIVRRVRNTGYWNPSLALRATGTTVTIEGVLVLTDYDRKIHPSPELGQLRFYEDAFEGYTSEGWKSLMVGPELSFTAGADYTLAYWESEELKGTEVIVFEDHKVKIREELNTHKLSTTGVQFTMAPWTPKDDNLGAQWYYDNKLYVLCPVTNLISYLYIYNLETGEVVLDDDAVPNTTSGGAFAGIPYGGCIGSDIYIIGPVDGYKRAISGGSWTAITTPSVNFSEYGGVNQEDGYLLVNSYNKIATFNGATWTDLYAGVFAASGGMIKYNGAYYWLTNGDILYKTEDNFTNLIFVAENISNLELSYHVCLFELNNVFYLLGGVYSGTPQTPMPVVMKSLNQGETWSEISELTSYEKSIFGETQYFGKNTIAFKHGDYLYISIHGLVDIASDATEGPSRLIRTKDMIHFEYVSFSTVGIREHTKRGLQIYTPETALNLDKNGVSTDSPVILSDLSVNDVISIPVKADTGDPAGIRQGQIVMNANDKNIKVYDGAVWRTIVSW